MIVILLLIDSKMEMSGMLNIFYGDMENIIYNTSSYFKYSYDRAWLDLPSVREMIADVDNSQVLSNGAIDSPVMGIIPPTQLSGGVKTLILVDNEPDKVFNASACGDNCAKWLLKMGECKDVTINLGHLMDFGEGCFQIKILNTGDIVTTMRELVPIAGRFV